MDKKFIPDHQIQQIAETYSLDAIDWANSVFSIKFRARVIKFQDF
jgi:hypothetical protein